MKYEIVTDAEKTEGVLKVRLVMDSREPTLQVWHDDVWWHVCFLTEAGFLTLGRNLGGVPGLQIGEHGSVKTN